MNPNDLASSASNLRTENLITNSWSLEALGESGGGEGGRGSLGVASPMHNGQAFIWSLKINTSWSMEHTKKELITEPKAAS